ncbi:MAG TPA: SIR2 family protein [Blastocatellia bacterium]|nr:SIR2 family protein [Blastocatellia bacterium]
MTAAAGEEERWIDGSLLVNDTSDLITHLATERFIDLIQKERRKGYGFVPFVGAGFSAPSGAPLITEIKTYLQRCICMTLGAEDPDMEAWDPRTDQWPPFIDRRRNEQTLFAPHFWSDMIFHELPRPEDPEFPVFAQGWGAAAEWRTALLFLSRLVRPGRGDGDYRRQPLLLAAPQQEIIDSCFREVLKEKYPALGHKMLAVLAGALRLDLVLTTNFDDLLERAFAGARNPLEVFEVHLGSSLPHWSAVSDVRSLIKLHGNRYSLRADYSLDELPSESDKKKFLEYLLSGKGRSVLSHPSNSQVAPLDFQNHLLVMGFSVSDRRTCAFIEYAWQHLHKNFRVFWLCYTKNDVDQIQKFTKEFCKKNGVDQHQKATSDEDRHSIILRHSDFGFFLLQLYQTIRRNLPPLGSLFPSVSRLTLPPMPSSFISTQKSTFNWLNSFCDEIRKHLLDFRKKGFKRYKLVVATSKSDVRGVTSACSEIYKEMEASSICLWMDMNDISSTDNLFETLLEAAYFRLGLENWTPVYIDQDERPRADEIRRLINSVAKPWVIFLNARETPGMNTMNRKDISENKGIPDNGWLDYRRKDLPPGAADPSACLEGFLTLLRELCGEGSKAVSVVLMCRDHHDPTKEAPLITELKKQNFRLVELNKDSKEQVDFLEESITAEAIKWTGGNKDKQRFLHALVLMQRPRLLATIWSSAVSLSKGSPADTLDDRQTWVQQLEEVGLLRRKAGGFIWIHSRCREVIRDILSNPPKRDTFFKKSSKAKKALKGWEPEKDEPEIHERLAEWYGKVLDASESPAAVFEAVYHFCRAAEASLTLNRSESAWPCKQIEAAAALLKANGFLIQTHGYSRGSCRHLEYIRDTLCPSDLDPDSESELCDAAQRLRIVCTEVMRMIAREVGEDAKLYLRHRQFGVFLAGEVWTRKHEEQYLEKDEDKALHISKKIHEKLNGLSAQLVPSDGNSSQHLVSQTYVNNPNAEWLRWWRWSGMLGIASRSFEVAKETFEKALIYATQDAGGTYAAPAGPPNLYRLIKGEFSILGRAPRRSQLQELRVEVLRVIEQYVELALLEDGVENRRSALVNSKEIIKKLFPEDALENRWSALVRASEIPSDPIKDALVKVSQNQADGTKDALAKLESIEEYIKFGQRLVLEIRNKDHSSDSHHTISANWCEGRLLMHKSVCATRRVQLNFGDEHAVLHEAMALLGDAESGLRISDPRRNRSELSMIELHRADARLHQAESVQIYEGLIKTRFEEIEKPLMYFAELSFAKMYRILDLMPMRSNWEEQGKSLRDLFLGGEKCALLVDEELRRAKSLVTDSMRFLNRAEPVLRTRRRNVWWTTWFFERRLRAIALSVWASVFEIDTPIPFLGLEAAMRKTDTLADTLLEDSIRMIRVDAYRLATIIDAYASCTKALQIRLILDRKTVRLKERQMWMHQSLVNALKALDDVERRRNRLAAKKWKTKGSMAKQAVAYVDVVRKRARNIAEQVKYPILN